MEEVQEAEFQLYKDIVFISEVQIKISHWNRSRGPCSGR